MAFSATKTGESIFGNKKVAWGTYTGGGTTGGDIDTGMHMCEHMQLTAKGSSVAADAPTVNETLPVAGNAVTIVITSDSDGYWFAIGDA